MALSLAVAGKYLRADTVALNSHYYVSHSPAQRCRALLHSNTLHQTSRFKLSWPSEAAASALCQQCCFKYEHRFNYGVRAVPRSSKPSSLPLGKVTGGPSLFSFSSMQSTSLRSLMVHPEMRKDISAMGGQQRWDVGHTAGRTTLVRLAMSATGPSAMVRGAITCMTCWWAGTRRRIGECSNTDGG